MIWMIAEILVLYLLEAEKCYKLSNLIKDYSNTIPLNRQTDNSSKDGGLCMKKWEVFFLVI